MILINLLPHREEKRRQRKRAFFATLGVCAVLVLAIAGAWYLVLMQSTSAQQARNDFLKAEIGRLELEIKDIATLRADDTLLLTLPSDREMTQTLMGAGGILLCELARGSSLWWTGGIPDAAAPLLVCRGLPDGGAFAAMLQGASTRSA